MNMQDILAWMEYDRKKDEEQMKKMFRVEPEKNWEDGVKCCFDCWQNGTDAGNNKQSTKAECDFKDKHDDGWVSVKDRLPRRGDCVLIYGTWLGSHIYRIASHVLEEQLKNVWKTETGMLTSEITHWRGLPSPPKRITNENK